MTATLTQQEKTESKMAKDSGTHLFVKKRNGRLEPLNLDKINKCAERACLGLQDVSASEIVLDASLQLFNKVSTSEIDKALILSARSKIEKEPNYSYAAARILANTIYKEVFGEGVDYDGFELQYRKSFIVNLKKLVKADRLHPKMLGFDLKRLADKLDISRDFKFKYLGLQTLYDRYFIHMDGRRMEAPQAFWMRVAMGLAVNEADKDQAAIDFYEVISSFLYCPSTPTLFNSGTLHPQLSSCYLSTTSDSIDSIFGTIHGQARLSKHAGGLGVDWTPIRGAGAYIKGTNGKSNGVVPWLKIFNDTLVAVNQGGKRKGAGCSYLETWHLDIEEFLDLRKNTGDDRMRCHDMNTANWIPDLFMKRVREDGEWTLFSPSDVPDLHDLFGPAFEARYAEYEEKAKAGEIKNHRVLKAKELWKKMLKSLIETGHPWITFKDPSNIRYSNQHVGVVHNSNLCTEILLHTKPSEYENGAITKHGETAVCNLGSLNLIELFRAALVSPKTGEHAPLLEVFFGLIQQTAHLAIRMLNNVIDENFYPTEEARNANMNNRPVGLGIMGFHDVLHEMEISYESKEAVAMSGDIHENIAYAATLQSAMLAKAQGTYPNYKGSLWDQGKLTIDTWEDLNRSRVKGWTYDSEKLHPGKLDWTPVRAAVKEFGVRNSNTLAIAPTATISYIQGCSQSIEPDYSVLHVYSTLSGDFTMVNEAFVKECKKRGLWCPELVDALKQVDGDISTLSVAEDLKQKFKTCFNLDQKKLIECAAERQKWIDMGQSMNLYSNNMSMKYLNDLYFHAWESCLKTTYYLRTQAASKIEKATTTVKKEVTPEQAASCSLEALRNGGTCEACQ